MDAASNTTSGPVQTLCEPPFAQWGPAVARNREQAAGWDFEVGGLSAAQMRMLARREVLSIAESFSTRLGLDIRPVGQPDDPIIATGHQPEFYHPGVWMKNFLLERFVRETGATGLDVVVDTDGFHSLGMSIPCRLQGIRRCDHTLAAGSPDSYFAATPVPGEDELKRFAAEMEQSVATLDVPVLSARLAGFMDTLASVAAAASDIAQLATMARRRYEARAGNAYAEAPVTAVIQGEAFRRFVAEIALNAERFASDYNAELASYRAANGTRSAAQPVPDLRVDDAVELPFWALTEGRRHPVYAARMDGVLRLSGDEGVLAECAADVDSLLECVEAGEVSYAPKALALSMFTRMFTCDAFIHGTGGARYDSVTDGIIRRYFKVEPPAYFTASMTASLPLESPVVSEGDVSAARERLNRLTHHPDEVVGEIVFADDAVRSAALDLVARKTDLVRRIAEPDADRKTLGLSIREVNAELAGMLAPVREELEAGLADVEDALRSREILTDRTYPFCFWDPGQIAELARIVD